MTKSPFIRAFFAIDLSGQHKTQIEKVIRILQTRHPDAEIRWTQPENLHITLHFLPAIHLSDLTTLTQHVLEAMHALPVFDITWGELELFPSKHHPHVISIAIHPSAALTQLVNAIGKSIVATGYPIEIRPFRAHLTLARIRHWDKKKSFLEMPLPIKTLSVGEIIFYQSKPGKIGSTYIPLQRFRLTDS